MGKFFKKRRVVFAFTLCLSLCIIAAGTFAWFSLAQRLTNEFTYEPYGVKLVKVSSADKTLRLEGAAFGLYDEDDVMIGRYVTDEKGEITLDFLDPTKNYYFKELAAPYGYKIKIADKEKKYEFSPNSTEITVENEPILSTLSVTKTIASKDLNGKDYTVTKEDKEFPFEFTVTIGDDSEKAYRYTIKGADGKTIQEYTYPTEDGKTIVQADSGTIQSGETLYLRDGETAVIEGIPVATAYRVKEHNYFSYDNPDFAENMANFEFGCEHGDGTGHTGCLTTASGWAGFGYNTDGNIREEGSTAVMENKRVPEGYEVTISSLVVVDRILANPEDVDYSKGFEVTVEIGDESDNIAYYYEVIHLPNTAEAVGGGYPTDYDYYDRNDPGVPDRMEPQPTTVPDPEHFDPYSLAPPASGKEPGSTTESGISSLPKIPTSYAAVMPLHTPNKSERWPQQDGSYGELMLSGDSEDNPKGSAHKIVVDLHHASAVIIYGIPVGTTYSTSQVDYRYIDGYILDSTNKDTGVILPDLDVRDDPDTQDARLRRVRADIYNYFVLPVMREMTVKKNWEHGSNTGPFPSGTEITVYDPNTNYVYDSRTYRAIDDWKASFEVPKYEPGTRDPIDYGVKEEDIPDDYIISGIEKTEDGYIITNTYAPGAFQPLVQKVVEGPETPNATYTFELKAVTSGAPMPESNHIATSKGAGYANFGRIQYKPLNKDEEREYRYTIQEKKGSDVTCTYDTSIYNLVVTVVEKDGIITSVKGVYSDAKGNTVATPTFINRYKKTATAPLTIKKLVSGSGADRTQKFKFRIEVEGYQTIEVKLKHGESYKTPEYPVGTSYKVTEIGEMGGYRVSVSGSASGTIKEKNADIVFTNTLDSSPGVGRLTLHKQVTGAGGEKDRSFRFTVQIGKDRFVVYLKSGEEWVSQPYSAGTAYTVVEDNYTAQGYFTTSKGAVGSVASGGSRAEFTNTRTTADKATLTIAKTLQGNGAEAGKRFRFTVVIGNKTNLITLAGGERYTFYDIPVGTVYRVTEADYTAEGYTTTGTASSGTISAGGNLATFVNQKGELEQGKTGSLTVTKTVTGVFVDATKKFRFVVTIGDRAYEIFLRHGESRTFERIPVGTAYSVVEDDYTAEDYAATGTRAVGTVTAAGATAAFVNEYKSSIPPVPDSGAVQISGKKTWVHGANAEANYPNAIVVYVMSGSTIVAQKTVTAADGWSYAFNLPKYDSSGAEITYSINEENQKNYSKTIKGYDITNIYTAGSPQTGDPNLLWVWFLWLAVGAAGLRFAVFYRKKRREMP